MLAELKEKIADNFFILKESLKSFRENNDVRTSAAFAYYGFFALIPLLLLVIYLLGYAISSQVVLKGIGSLISRLFPQVNEIIIKEIYLLSQHVAVWGALSIIALLWAITPIASTLRSAFLTIFKTEKELPFFKEKLLDAVAVLVILILFLFLALSEVFYFRVIEASFGKLPILLNISNIIASLFLTTLFMSFFYLSFSPVKLRFIYLLAGSLVTAILWSIMKPVFSLFLTINPNYGFAFGSLKAVFIILLWIYCSFTAILLGAEVIVNARKRDALLLKKVFSEAQISNKRHRSLMKKFGRTYNEGETVFREGDKGSDMFFILSGSVNINKKGQTLKILREGEYFGEMSLLLNAPRTATATVVKSDTHLVVISQDNFEIILKEEPKIALSLLKEMALRLKMTDEYL